MSGLAAMYGADVPTAGGRPPAVSMIADALTTRGFGTADWYAGDLQLAVRSAAPVVHSIGGGALVIDGDGPVRELGDRYATGGAPAVLAGPNPYTLVLADADRQRLLLARNGDGPTLYFARRGPAVLVASEPEALIRAGVPARPDPTVMARFLETGACDDTPATFFAGITRVLPGQVVEIDSGFPSAGRGQPSRNVPVRIRARRPVRALPGVAAALAATDFRGRTGLRLGCGAGGAAVFGTALTAAERARPLPVYTTTFPELAAADRAGQLAAELLEPYARGAVRARALPVFADQLDIDAYLADVGEPTPQLADWLRWTVARRAAGELDTLVDGGSGGYLSRLADRIASRCGVAVRLPLCGVPDPDGQLSAIAHELLPAIAGYAGPPLDEPATDALLPELLARLRTELITTFLAPRAGSRDPGGLAEVLALLAGRPVDTRRLWRRYVLERWLRSPALCTGATRPARLRQVRTAPATAAVAVAGAGSEPPATGEFPGPVAAGGRRWCRQPVRTELLAAGDKLVEQVAWHVGQALDQSGTGPWYALLAAKPAAVMQGRARPLWEIRPGWTARLLHRVTGRQFGPDAPWALQVAIAEGGWWRMVAGVLAVAFGFPRSYARLAGPKVRAIRRPRPDAQPPAQVAMVPAPSDPDQLAADLVLALRNTLPSRAYRQLGGCAVVAGEEVIGWSGRPGAGPPLRGLLAALAAGDPFGDDQTPIVLGLPTAIEPG